MTAVEFFAGFWWLIFPIMGFAFGGFGMFARHRQSQKALDILKAYVDQGKDPPPEVLRAVYGQADPNAPGYGAPPPGYGPGPGPAPGYGPGPGYNPGWGGTWGGWGGWRAYRWGPYWAWRRVIVFTCLAAGFGWASWYEGGGPAEGFTIVAVIMTVLAVGSLLTALMTSLWRPK